MNQSKITIKNLEHENFFKRAEFVIQDFQNGKYDNEPDAKTFLEEYMKKNNIKF